MQMHSHHPSYSLWWLRIATFALAALAAASAAFWVLKWTATTAAPTSAALVSAGANPADPQAVARLLGGAQTQAAADMRPGAGSRFKLTGVVADRLTGGYALIAIDGKPAQPYRVGTRVDDTLVLQSVAPRSAALAAGVDAPVSLTLELPPLAPP